MKKNEFEKRDKLKFLSVLAHLDCWNSGARMKTQNFYNEKSPFKKELPVGSLMGDFMSLTDEYCEFEYRDQ